MPRYKAVQAKDIPDGEVIAVVERICAIYGREAHNTEVFDSFDEYPEKVVLAKLRKLGERGVLVGCACGCRGDWRLA